MPALKYWDGSAWQYVLPGGGAAAVGTLPASPYDGQEVYYYISGKDSLWHLRYNAGFGDAYKWQFVGGAPLEGEYNAAVSTAIGAVAWLDLTAGNLPQTAPLAGIYDMHYGANAYQTTDATLRAVNVGLAWTGSTDPATDNAYAGVPSVNGVSGSTAILLRRTLAAGAVVKDQVQRHASQASTVRMRWLQLTPVRVG